MEIRSPRERVIRIDHLLLIHNPDILLEGGELPADLECGHKALVRSMTRAVCPRCTEMLRRSLHGEEDWEAFRYRGSRDRMIWREDRLRQFNEPTDLGGNFTHDATPTHPEDAADE